MHLTESQPTQRYALSKIIPKAFIANGQPEIFSGNSSWVPMTKGSFAVSSNAASAQKRMKELETQLLSCETYRTLIDSPIVAGLFQMHLNLPAFEETWDQGSFINEKERAQLENRLLTTFEAEPVEDGIDHPADNIIRDLLETGENQNILDMLQAFSLNESYSSFAASVLRCLGRQPHLGTVAWRTTLVRDALSINDVEIRDAAIQVAELWADREMRPVLEQHTESEPWLRDYISDVLTDLGD